MSDNATSPTDITTANRFLALTKKHGWVVVEAAPKGWNCYWTVPGKYGLTDELILSRTPLPAAVSSRTSESSQPDTMPPLAELLSGDRVLLRLPGFDQVLSGKQARDLSLALGFVIMERANAR